MKFDYQYTISKDLILGLDKEQGGWVFYRLSDGATSQVFRSFNHARKDMMTRRLKMRSPASVA